jgi:septum formation protein
MPAPPNRIVRPRASLATLSEAAPLLLASASPRRREILAQLGIPILVSAVDVDESVQPGEAPAPYLERVTTAKLAAATKIAASACAAVLVADTSVIDGGAILGKPTSDDDAREMIARLAGKTHEVWTRFAIGAPGSESRVLHEETVRTRVTFRALTPKQVSAYVASGEGTDKAGAYAVQGRGAGIVSRIEGSYTNVVGLPACEVMVAFERLGLSP